MSSRDWSSGVCSSDLGGKGIGRARGQAAFRRLRLQILIERLRLAGGAAAGAQRQDLHDAHVAGLGEGQDVSRLHLVVRLDDAERSEEHTSELQSLMRISYAVFCLKKKKTKK